MKSHQKPFWAQNKQLDCHWAVFIFLEIVKSKIPNLIPIWAKFLLHRAGVVHIHFPGSSRCKRDSSRNVYVVHPHFFSISVSFHLVMHYMCLTFSFFSLFSLKKLKLDYFAFIDVHGKINNGQKFPSQIMSHEFAHFLLLILNYIWNVSFKMALNGIEDWIK